MNYRKGTLIIALVEDFLVSMSANENEENLSDEEINLISEIIELVHKKYSLSIEKLKDLKTNDEKVKQILEMISSLDIKNEVLSNEDYDNIYQDIIKYVDYNILTDTIIEIDETLLDLMINSYQQSEQYEKCAKLNQVKQKLKDNPQLS